MLIWWSYITIHESRQYVVYRNIKLQHLRSIRFTFFTSPPLACEHKTDNTHWETIKHTVTPATYTELSLHKYRTGTKFVQLLKHFQENCKVWYIHIYICGCLHYFLHLKFSQIVLHEECQHAHCTQNQSPQQRYTKRIYSTIITISDSLFVTGT